MTRTGILRWSGLLFFGVALGVAGAVMYEHNIARDTAGLIAGVGWITAAVSTVWLTIKVFRALPLRYSDWAMLAAVPVALVSVGLHALIFALTNAEEPFFFILAIFGAPMMFIGGFFGRVMPRDAHAGRAGTLQRR